RFVGQTAAASMPVQPLIEHIPGGFGLSHPKALTLTRTCGTAPGFIQWTSGGLPVDFRWTSDSNGTLLIGTILNSVTAAGIDTGHVLRRQAMKPSQSPVSMFRPRIRGRIYRKITLRWVIFLMK
ncbi:MAG: hypothetical protein ACI97B_004898, partial [Verrucomicrobiales bacterium]